MKVFTDPPQVVNEISLSSSLIKHVKPELAFNGSPTSAPNDTLYEDTWYFKNNATISCGPAAPVAGADIKMEQAWNRNNEFGYGQAYNGNGVDVGLVEFYNFEWSHPELIGQYKPGWDSHYPNGGQAITGDFYNRYGDSHGTWASSILAGNGNNTTGNIGVAYGAKMRPYHGDWDNKRLVIMFATSSSK